MSGGGGSGLLRGLDCSPSERPAVLGGVGGVEVPGCEMLLIVLHEAPRAWPGGADSSGGVWVHPGWAGKDIERPRCCCCSTRLLQGSWGG